MTDPHDRVFPSGDVTQFGQFLQVFRVDRPTDDKRSPQQFDLRLGEFPRRVGGLECHVGLLVDNFERRHALVFGLGHESQRGAGDAGEHGAQRQGHPDPFDESVPQRIERQRPGRSLVAAVYLQDHGLGFAGFVAAADEGPPLDEGAV